MKKPTNKLLLLTLSTLLATAVPVTTRVFAQAATAPAPATAAAQKPDPFWPADGDFHAKGRTSSWSGFRQKNLERRGLFADRRDLDQNSIVFVGDSITEGWKTLDSDFAALNAKVANRGIGGDTTPNLLYRLQDDVLSLNPKAIVLTIGTNDLGEHTSPEDIAENMKAILAKIRERYPDIPIAWCLVMPRQADDDYPQRIKRLNSLIREIAEKDPKITVVDTFTPLAQADGSSKPEDYVPDRLHLNGAGYAVWREVLRPVLLSWHLN